MNNKGTMEQKNKLIPELRFPEFVKDGEWIEEKLGVLSNVIIGGTPSTTVEEYWNGNIGWIGSGELKNDLIKSPTKYITELGLKKSSTYLLPKDTTVLAMTGATLAKIGYLTFECCGNQSVAGFVNLKNLNSKYLYYQLQNQTKQIFSFAGGGAQAGINKYNIENILLQIPQKIDVENKEQQKIADCLSSLDELITAHNDKLETLKNHKKGLLQNLFPQEGQKVPNYRFPEFVNDGEWKPTTVENNCNVKGRIGFRGYTKEDLVSKEKGVFVIGGKHIQNQMLDLSDPTYLSWDKYYESPEIMIELNDIVFSQRGTLGDCAIIDKEIGEATINPSMVLLKKIKCNPRFLYYILIGEKIQNEVAKSRTSAAIPMLSQKQIKEFSFHIPNPKEQQKIADCLLAVDNLITAQTEKIEQLKAHKKGLMQGLFPKIEE